MKIYKRSRLTFLMFSASVLMLVMSLVTQAAPNNITRVSVAVDGTEGNGLSDNSATSADGRYVVFESFASNLVSGDTNGLVDVFLRDTQSGATTRVSVASDGTQGNDHSNGDPAISADGRYVAFSSWATNLVGGDTNGWSDIFVHDTQTGVTTRVSVASGGTQGNNSSGAPAISADGRYVTFASGASNLVSGDTNSDQDIFVHDTQTGSTTRVSIASDGTQANNSCYSPAISAAGRYVAFATYASNLVSGDTNGLADAFIHDSLTSVTTRISVASDGTQGNNDSDSPIISADGRYVAFRSEASNLVSGDTNGTYDIFLHDTQTNVTTRVSVASDGTQGNGGSHSPAISADGRYVAFSSYATNLTSGDVNGYSDIFVHDTQTGDTIRISQTAGGMEGNGHSYDPVILNGGLYVAFESEASNLVSGDTNGVIDVFVYGNSDMETIKVYLPMVVRSSP